MRTGIVLVDFDNATKISKLGIAPRQNDVNRLVDQLVFNCTDTLYDQNVHFEELQFLFYSGWHNEECNQFTDLYFMLKNYIDQTSKRYKKTRLRFKVPLGLAARPEASLLHTKRQHSGVRVYRPKTSSTCIGGGPCLMHEIIQIRKKSKCPRAICDHVLESLIVYHEQKTVDTHIVCDLITYSCEKDIAFLSLVSDDDDFVPGLIQASLNIKDIVWVRQKKVSRYDDLLTDIIIINI